jgi:hypothetical protein
LKLVRIIIVLSILTSCVSQVKKVDSVQSVKKVDFVIINPTEAEALFDFMQSYLELPKEWDYGKHGDFSSGGVFAGNISLSSTEFSVLAAQSTISGIALEPSSPTEILINNLTQMNVPFEADPQKSNSKGSVIDLSALSSDYSVFYYDKNKNRGSSSEESFPKPQGHLGIMNVAYISISDASNREMWESVLYPSKPVEGLFPIASGPGIKIVEGDTREIQSIIFNVDDISLTKDYLKETQMIGTEKDDVVYIDPEKSFGILFGFIENTKDEVVLVPEEMVPFFREWKITLGSGKTIKNIVSFRDENYFYTLKENNTDWIVYKTPNSGVTTRNSSNTRSELHNFTEWIPEEGGNLTGTLKVQHVSTTGDATIPASFCVVVGQIHSSEGHKNEPLKIFYKKYPGQTKGSLFWTYEINTEGDNAKRWDYATPIWGNDWSVLGKSANDYPEEPTEGIELGEVFSYEINVYKGIMSLTFSSENHETKVFTKSLIESDYTDYSDIPEQILTIFAKNGQDGIERSEAYAGELQYFKQGAYNQANGKDPSTNMIWSTGSEIYEGDIAEQYANGSYTEVWFKSSSVGAGIAK